MTRPLAFSAMIKRGLATAASAPRKTPLYDWHVAKGAQMVEFAGYSMPLQYKGVGQVQAHNHVREKAGLFDVSHMQQLTISQDASSSPSFTHHLLPLSLSHAPSTSSYSLLINKNGGIIDDCIATNWGDGRWYIVTNAGRAKEVQEWLDVVQKEWEGPKVKLEYLTGRALLALQGPTSSSVLAKHTTHNLNSLPFGTVAHLRISSDIDVHVARGGYTGEDGFEISMENKDAVKLADLLADSEGVLPIGLGARDSLRLEAGMCLYGHDLWETEPGPDGQEKVGTTVGEAGLAWVIAKDRRTPDSPAFIGRDTVLPSLKASNTRRKRVGLVVSGSPAREGAVIVDRLNSTPLGKVTSGIPSPTLGKNIVMGYIDTADGLHKKGSEVKVIVRGKERNATVTSLPFVESKYFRGT